MKQLKFEHTNKSWDRYGAFHNRYGGLVHFETGEVMVTACDVDNRKMYHEFGIQIVASTDAHCPPLFLDKECTEPCPKAWLSQGSYTPLAIDHEQKLAFALSHPHAYIGKTVGECRKLISHLPKHMSDDCLGYWSDAERKPIANKTTRLQKPNAEWRKKVCPVLLSEVVPTITAMYRMQEPPHWSYRDGAYAAKQSWLESSAEEIIEDILNVPEKGRDNFYKKELDDDDRKSYMYRIATHGFKNPRKTFEVNFLYTKGE